jgi:heterodisulfide reductase subunit A-like polyferredoxin
MPASPWEIEEAEAEGIPIIHRQGVKQILSQAGKVSGIELKAVERVFDEQGRFAPAYFEDQVSSVTADAVIMAIGQKTNLTFLTEADGVAVTPRGLIQADPDTKATSRAGVFAGGDVETGPFIAIAAVAAGREAAISIDNYLAGKDLRADREFPIRPLPAGQGQWNPIPGDAKAAGRAAMPHLPVADWAKGYKEIMLGFDEDAAVAEAARCLNCGVCSECMQCVAACQAGAVDHHQKPRNLTLEVGALILSPGFRTFDARHKAEYGYGRYPNVVTSLEFERLLSATGPCAGHVRRPSDGSDPQRIAWIQCVGSRDASIGREYCSYVCCMYAAKQAIIAREHDPRVAPTVFFIDFRAQGKGFDRYYERAREAHGVRFIRALPSRVVQDPGTKNLELAYVDAAGQVQTETFDLVVLSVGLRPHPAAAQLAQVCGIDTDRYGFVKSPPFRLVSTSRAGIFTCGVYQAPRDIPETVVQASAAAGAAAALLADSQGTLTTRPEFPPERDIAAEEPRIGVFVCHCGVNIAGVVDVAKVADYARSLPGVAYADHFTFTCATDSLDRMREVIEANRLNRVVVASCSPRTHEGLFQDNLRKSGLNKYLFEMANIRDQDSWVHQKDPAHATAKAQELVHMAVARAAALEPLQEVPFEVVQSALVVGNGLAALTAALTIADAGYQVHLAALEDRYGMGGLAYRVRYNLEGEDIQAFVHETFSRVDGHPRIRWWPKTRVASFSGHIGNFRSLLVYEGDSKELDYGVAVIATGGVEYQPSDYLYGQHPRVLTLMELDNRIVAEPEFLKSAPRVAMIQCVGSREPEHPYCSRICCGQAIKNAIRIKEANPQAQVSILYRDIRTYGLREIFYRKARELGVRFHRFEPEQKPEVAPAGDALRLTVFDQNLQAPVKLDADCLALAAAIRPHPLTGDVAQVFKLPFDADGFLMEAHQKLKPVDFAASGLFLCGLAHGPKYFAENMAQAQGAAARALGVLSQKYISVGGQVAEVNPLKCIICLTCLRTCPFGVPRIDQAKGVAEIDAAACHGCGNCASACPRKAIEVRHHRDRQFIAKIGAIDLEPWPEDEAAL